MRDGDRAVARVVRAPSVEATDPAFECHSARDFPTGAEACVCACVWCECLSMARFETTRAASFALIPISVGVQKLK